MRNLQRANLHTSCLIFCIFLHVRKRKVWFTMQTLYKVLQGLVHLANLVQGLVLCLGPCGCCIYDCILSTHPDTLTWPRNTLGRSPDSLVGMLLLTNTLALTETLARFPRSSSLTRRPCLVENLLATVKSTAALRRQSRKDRRLRDLFAQLHHMISHSLSGVCQGFLWVTEF